LRARAHPARAAASARRPAGAAACRSPLGAASRRSAPPPAPAGAARRSAPPPRAVGGPPRARRDRRGGRRPPQPPARPRRAPRRAAADSMRLYGGGFLPALAQLVAFYYPLGLVLHVAVPALLPVKGIQKEPRGAGEPLRDAVASLGARGGWGPGGVPTWAASASGGVGAGRRAGTSLVVGRPTRSFRRAPSPNPNPTHPKQAPSSSRPPTGPSSSACTRPASASSTPGPSRGPPAGATCCSVSRCWTTSTTPGSTGRTGCCTGGRCTDGCTGSTTGGGVGGRPRRWDGCAGRGGLAVWGPRAGRGPCIPLRRAPRPPARAHVTPPPPPPAPRPAPWRHPEQVQGAERVHGVRVPRRRGAAGVCQRAAGAPPVPAAHRGAPRVPPRDDAHPRGCGGRGGRRLVFVAAARALGRERAGAARCVFQRPAPFNQRLTQRPFPPCPSTHQPATRATR
jgi:hypothetical protein